MKKLILYANFWKILPVNLFSRNGFVVLINLDPPPQAQRSLVGSISTSQQQRDFLFQFLFPLPFLNGPIASQEILLGSSTSVISLHNLTTFQFRVYKDLTSLKKNGS